MPYSANVGESKVIVVVDDEPSVLATVAAMLESAGYEVLRAISSDQALRIARERSGPIDLLLSDVIMPGQSGPVMADRFLGLHPEAQCLFMAGLPDNPEISERVLNRGLPFLSKPFLPGTLVGKVREVLGSEAGRAMAAN